MNTRVIFLEKEVNDSAENYRVQQQTQKRFIHQLFVLFQFEGIPFHPGPDRFWAIVDKYKVTKFYTAPTAIRALMKSGDAPVLK